MAPPRAHAAGPGTMLQQLLLGAVTNGDLRAFKRIATALDGGKGRIRKAVEAVRDRAYGVLHVAAGRGRIPVCAYMVEELQTDVNAADESGDTPLSHAVRAGNIDTVSYLLGHGADPDKPVDFECTVLHVAVGKGMCEMVELLLSKEADINSLSHCGTPLHIAAMENQVAAMKILLDHGADCNKEFSALFTPLFTALEARSLNCVKLLIKVTPLIFAANKGLTDFYECLLEASADPDAPDDFGLRPIEIAAYQNKQKDVEILLPVTSRIPSVRDWSVKGILTYIKSIPTDEAIMNAQSRDATLFSNRSLCWIKMGDGDKPLLDAEACRTMEPYWPKACYRQGVAHMFLKDYGKACDAFLDGLKLDPSNVDMENELREALDSLKISRAGNKAS